MFPHFEIVLELVLDVILSPCSGQQCGGDDEVAEECLEFEVNSDFGGYIWRVVAHDGYACIENLDGVRDIPCGDVLEAKVVGISAEPVQFFNVE